MSDLIPVRVAALAPRGFNRGGRHWPQEPTDTEVTPEVYAVIKAEKKLSVIRLDELMAGSTGTGALGDEHRKLTKAYEDLEGAHKELLRDFEGLKRDHIGQAAQLRQANKTVERVQSEAKRDHDASAVEAGQLRGKLAKADEDLKAAKQTIKQLEKAAEKAEK